MCACGLGPTHARGLSKWLAVRVRLRVAVRLRVRVRLRVIVRLRVGLAGAT